MAGHDISDGTGSFGWGNQRHHPPRLVAFMALVLGEASGHDDARSSLRNCDPQSQWLAAGWSRLSVGQWPPDLPCDRGAVGDQGILRRDGVCDSHQRSGFLGHGASPVDKEACWSWSAERADELLTLVVQSLKLAPFFKGESFLP